MKKFISLLILAVLLVTSVSAFFPSGRDIMRLQLLHRSPDAAPIYFRGGLISNIYGGLPAKYSPQDGQIYFPHYYSPQGGLSYRPNDYIIYGSSFGNAGAFAGYYPGQSYGVYNYNWQQYSQNYGLQASQLYSSAYPYNSYSNFGSYPYGAYYNYLNNFGNSGSYGNYGSSYNYGGFGGYNPYITGAYGGSASPGVNIYTGYGDNIYPGPFGYGGDYPLTV